MLYWTYEDIKTKVERDLDLQEETFVEDAEMMGYCNEAIDEAEAEIHKIHEDYFLTYDFIPLVTGTIEYDLPSDIYANKIRGVVYSNGSIHYPVARIKDTKMFERIALYTQYGTTDDYVYYLRNDATSGPQMGILPAARETSSTVMKRWYIRNAKRITALTDECDIPEFVQFVIQYMKVRCYEKEGHPNLEFAVAKLQQQRALMVQTLTDMVVDSDNKVEFDFGHYEDHV